MPRSHRDTENLGILGKRFPLEVALGLGPDDWKSRLFGRPRVFVAVLAWLLLFTNGVAQGSPQQPTTSSLSSNELVHAQALINQGKLDEAITLLDELNHRQPGTPGLEAKLGKPYYQKRSFQQAVTHFQAALH